MEHEGAQHYVEMQRGHGVSRIPAPEDMVGKSLTEARFRSRTGLTVLTVIHNESGRETRIQPEPSTVIQKSDALIVMGPVDAIRKLGGQV